MTRFPADFIWGTATAAHQVEGSNTNTDWWRREHRPDTDLPEPSGDAADSYHRYGEDIALVADAGLGAYRFSIEWARIEPEPGVYSRAQIDHYRRMVDACRDRGIEPVVTLHHVTNPIWFTREGAWRASDAAEHFARYTEAALPVLDDVTWVFTINEPNMIATHRDFEAAEMHLAKRPEPDMHVAETLAAAHRAAREVLSGHGHVRSGWTIGGQAFQALPGAEGAMRDYAYAREDFFIDAAVGDDVIGVQNYSRNIIGADGPVPLAEGAETNLLGWEYWPQSIGEELRHCWERGKGTPLLVTENGFATRDDDRRIDHTRDALASVKAAMDDGVDVRGYLYWSLLDNYEWGSYDPTFGLVAWDRDTFERRPKPSLRWLGRVARTGAVPDAA